MHTHPATTAPAAEVPVAVTVALSQLGQGKYKAHHHHPHHLIVWAKSATVTVRTEGRDWLVPPTQGLWLPAGIRHAVDGLRPGASCTIAIAVQRFSRSWLEPVGVGVTPLIRELVDYLESHTDRDDTRIHAEALLMDLLEPTTSTSLDVPLPTDPRIRIIAEALIANPADQRDLATWGHQVGAGVRTLTRLFSTETGMTFASWRTHVRVRAALNLLARGNSVGATARAVGYRKPGAFSDAFQRVTGQAPSIYSPPSGAPSHSESAQRPAGARP